MALLKHTGCLQDAWNSVGCFGDDYHTISEDIGGAWRPLMACTWCVNRFSIDFHGVFVEFPWFLQIFMIFLENYEKSMKLNKNQWKVNRKTVDTSTAGHQRAPGTAGVLWYCVVIIPKAPHTIPSVLEAASVFEERQIVSEGTKLFCVIFQLFLTFI